MTGRILVIDDDPLLRRLTARLLSAEGLEVASASGGEEGLKKLEESPFDALICDLLMPGLSGLDVVRAIRRDPRRARLPILLLTGQGHREDRDAAMAAGADLYMTKPFSSFELREALGNLLSLGEGRRAS